MLENNPLINPPKQNFNAPDLAGIKPEHIEPAVDWAIEKAKANIEAIVASKDEPTFENTIEALLFADEDLDRVFTLFSNLSLMSNTAEVQAVEKLVKPKVIKHGTEVSLNMELFKKVKYVYDTIGHEVLSDEQRTLLEKTYNHFKFNGALLGGADREEYKALKGELSELTASYSNNCVNSLKDLKVVVKAADRKRLLGIPDKTIDTYIANAKNDPDAEEGDFVIKMQPPPEDIFIYAYDRNLREEVMSVYNRQASEGKFDNTENVKNILRVRHRIAQLLGFKHHAEKTIRPDTRMTENFETALNFVQDNVKTYFPVAREFMKELSRFAKENYAVHELKPWDTSYYTRLMKEAKVGYNPKELEPYLEFESILGGLFEHTEKLQGLSFKDAAGKYSVPNEDVRVYEVLDVDTKEVKGVFYVDPYARDYKKTGAWHLAIRNAGLDNGKQEVPISIICCNFQKPAEGNPTLISVGDVTKLFHETGHACHNFLGNGKYRNVTGRNVHRDYVELPSQVNEFWALQPEVMKGYVKHHETGEVVPDDLIDKLLKAKDFGAGSSGLVKSRYGLIDMMAYTTDPEEITDIVAFEEKILGPTKLMDSDSPPKVLTFNHIFTLDYTAGYHGYKWADALVADVAEQFEEGGLYNKELCKAFRDCLVSPGGASAPSKLFKDFTEALGQGRRDVDTKAVLRKEGILPKKVKGCNL